MQFLLVLLTRATAHCCAASVTNRFRHSLCHTVCLCPAQLNAVQHHGIANEISFEPNAKKQPFNTPHRLATGSSHTPASLLRSRQLLAQPLVLLPVRQLALPAAVRHSPAAAAHRAPAACQLQLTQLGHVCALRAVAAQPHRQPPTHSSSKGPQLLPHCPSHHC